MNGVLDAVFSSLHHHVSLHHCVLSGQEHMRAKEPAHVVSRASKNGCHVNGSGQGCGVGRYGREHDTGTSAWFVCTRFRH